MLLVTGGQLDPNIGALLRRVLVRGVAFKDLLVGPGMHPPCTLHPDGRLELDGVVVDASACFIRHDVFMAQRSGAAGDSRAALNWHHAIKGWALSQPSVRLFNRFSRGDYNKVESLALARGAGLSVPATLITNAPSGLPASDFIMKPVAGGELTEPAVADTVLAYPYIFQARLSRPEMRVYIVGERHFGFSIESPDLDYRQHHNVELKAVEAPLALIEPLLRLTRALGLEFAAADFMQDEHGDYQFLEINSQPMFAAFDKVVSGRLCDAMIDWLTKTPPVAGFDAPEMVSPAGFEPLAIR